MPYQEHRAFDPPKNWDATIWRYLSIPQFISLIEHRKLHFTRADNFEDPFEGTFPHENIIEMGEELGDIILPETARVRYNDGEKKGIRWKHINERSSVEIFRRMSFLNCWHVKPHESVAMWNSHLSTEGGVALKSTAKRLRDSFHTFKQNDVFIGKVKYVDYKSDKIPNGNLLHPYTYKRKGFEHENELRAVVTSPPVNPDKFKAAGKDEEIPLKWSAQPTGMNIQIDIDTLIEGIRISPNAPSWHKKLFTSVLETYDIDISIENSSLAVEPSYLE